MSEPAQKIIYFKQFTESMYEDIQEKLKLAFISKDISEIKKIQM